MSTNTRTFNFPISALTREARRLLAALQDAVVGPAVVSRLPADLASAFTLQISNVEKGGVEQSGAAGVVGTLTEAQTRAFAAMERLMGAARRSAALAFPANPVTQRSEFQVGVHEPRDIASVTDRARKILAATQTHAAELAATGWTAADAQALAGAIDVLGGVDQTQEATKNKKKGVTAIRNEAANLLYKQCLFIQNAARLAYPDDGTIDEALRVQAYAHFLLETFPPRAGTSTEDEPATSGKDSANGTPANASPAPVTA